MFCVRQVNDHPRVPDVPAAVGEALARLRLAERIAPGQRVAVAVGSRGVADLPAIVASIVAHVRGLGAEPYIVPAMGSHGGATAAGQVAVLAALGITAEQMGCEIRATMGTVGLGRTAEGVPVYMDREAWSADHLVVCNRVRPHASFHGAVESGLLKMLVVGLGNYTGARSYHQAFERLGFERVVHSAGRAILAAVPLAAALAVVENGFGQVAAVEALPPGGLEAGEVRLLGEAKKWLPRFPVAAVDLLIVDEMGKNVSGTGLDRKLIGPPRSEGEGLPAKAMARLSRVGAIYWQQVVRPGRSPLPGADERPIGHAEFLGTFARLGLAFVRRAARRRPAGGNGQEEAAPGWSETGRPAIGQVFVRSLTPQSLGNATGLDRADLCTGRLLDAVSWRATLLNSLASGSVILPAAPARYATDREALAAVLAAARQPAGSLRVMRIRNTARLAQFQLSAAFADEIAQRPDLVVVGEEQEMVFDPAGNLLPGCLDG